MENKYPEHEKQAKIIEVAHGQTEYLEWLENEKGLVLCEKSFDPGELFGDVDFIYTRAWPSWRKLLAEYHGIDLDKIESEKKEMLEAIRDQK